jgi:hypothetical protein
MRLSRLISLALLALVLAVTAVRAVRLAGGGPLLAAHGERLWFGWAYRDPDIAGRFAAAAPRLAPGETVVVTAPPGRYEARWLRVMARYYLPAQTIAGVYPADAVPPLPAGVAVVDFAAGGGVTVTRPGDGAAAGR